MDPRRWLRRIVTSSGLLVPLTCSGHEVGECLEVTLTDLDGRSRAVSFEIVAEIGGGYAAQVYRARLLSVHPTDTPLRPGESYAIKCFVPRGKWRRRLRDLLFLLGFQAPFPFTGNEDAVACGMLWQALIRRAAHARFGDPQTVVRPFGYFFDERLKSFAEVNEWVDGRLSPFEPDPRLLPRFFERITARVRGLPPPPDSPSTAFERKRRFMARFVELLREVGAPELARQYLWWTGKSQPNVLERSDSRGGERFVAIDFRPGMTVLPCLPLSPADFGFILQGLRRGVLVQFDRGDPEALERFACRHPQAFEGAWTWIAALKEREARYRRSMPDVFHHRLRLLRDRSLREAIRHQRITGWERAGQISPSRATRLHEGGRGYLPLLFTSLLPIVGKRFQRLLGNERYRAHLYAVGFDSGYRKRFLDAFVATDLLEWLRAGRIGEVQAIGLYRNRRRFWLHRLFLSVLPAPLHRAVGDPRHLIERIRVTLRGGWRFLRDPAHRLGWLVERIEEAARESGLDPRDTEGFDEDLHDPQLDRYLVDLGVGLLLKPTSQLAYLGLAGYAAATGDLFPLLLLCALPISVSGTLRAFYLGLRAWHFRNFGGYRTAILLSPLKGIGIVALPIQMIQRFPHISLLLGSAFIRRLVSHVPVFGERGGLCEYLAFRLCYDLPRSTAILLGWLPPDQEEGLRKVDGKGTGDIIPKLFYPPSEVKEGENPSPSRGTSHRPPP
ncbi:MAG: hypothetical protein D6812_14565 [Deltaproteobacteria bacterium]|nr:MAG: hypothetical protein D6812_14565 [Deltaproteobacteria bacterium]